MKNFVFLVIVAIITLAILLFIFNPQVLADIWLWIIGLIGAIIAIIKNIIDSIVNFFKRSEDKKKEPVPKPKEDLNNLKSKRKIRELEEEIEKLQLVIKNQNKVDTYDGTTISVLRYFDDGETTLGLLFFEDQFFSYALEDTFQEIKVPGQTRIPKGNYNLDYYKVLTPLTQKYRSTRDWFDYHIHIQNVDNFSNVYIHCGSDHTHTEGCLLIADSIYSSNEKRTIFNSRKTYERFYKEIKKLKAEEQDVRIKIFDEDWFEINKLKNRNT